MSYLPFTLLAYFLNSIAVTIDKFLLTKKIPDPFLYIFYISAFSLLALSLLPFTHVPAQPILILASISTILWTLGAYFMFKALKVGQVSRVIPVIGALTPAVLLIFASLEQAISQNQMWAVSLLIAGLILLTVQNLGGKLIRQELILEIFASLLFALSYIFLRQAYLQQDFLTVLVWSRMILIPIAFLIIVTPHLRRKIFTPALSQFKLRKGAGLIFLAGQVCGGLAGILLTFSISLANPVLVNSLQGTQYVFILIFSLILAKKYPQVFKEKTTYFLFILKIIGILVIGLGLFILSLSPNLDKSVKLGVTYSPKYAYELGLEPKITYLKILDELGVKAVRLPIYWDQIENFPHNLSFSQIDYYLNRALERGVEVILVLGYKQPRWPECFAPYWVRDLIRAEREERILDLVEKEVNHFKSYPNILAWQVENEPFLNFGYCDGVDQRSVLDLVKKEIEIVKAADSRPILLTDSGELSLWVDTIGLSDWFGTTVYRTVWSRWFGIIDYPLPPAFYSLKDKLVRAITKKAGPTIISELQAEPWAPDRKRIDEFSVEEQARLIGPSKILQNLAFAKETGFDQTYLWGVEWWYYMAKHGHPEYLEAAKALF